jgi:hypothetical protein
MIRGEPVRRQRIGWKVSAIAEIAQLKFIGVFFRVGRPVAATAAAFYFRFISCRLVCAYIIPDSHSVFQRTSSCGRD